MLKDRTAVVTGSTSGIGLGIARELAGVGANIVLNGFGNPDEIEQLRNDLAARHNVKVTYSSANMTNPEDIRKMVAQAVKSHGSVDILVNNAGVQFVAPVGDFPDDQWDTILAVNLSAAFHAIKAAVPVMRTHRWGRIINIASAHGLVGSPGKAAYVAAKHGLVGLTKVAALDLVDDGITCNAICPGWVLTPLVEKQIEAKAKQQGISIEEAKVNLLKEKQPLVQFTTPENLGALTIFLCSEAAATITGASLPVDGAWTAQ